MAARRRPVSASRGSTWFARRRAQLTVVVSGVAVYVLWSVLWKIPNRRMRMAVGAFDSRSFAAGDGDVVDEGLGYVLQERAGRAKSGNKAPFTTGGLPLTIWRRVHMEEERKEKEKSSSTTAELSHAVRTTEAIARSASQLLSGTEDQDEDQEVIISSYQS